MPAEDDIVDDDDVGDEDVDVDCKVHIDHVDLYDSDCKVPVVDQDVDVDALSDNDDEEHDGDEAVLCCSLSSSC